MPKEHKRFAKTSVLSTTDIKRKKQSFGWPTPRIKARSRANYRGSSNWGSKDLPASPKQDRRVNGRKNSFFQKQKKAGPRKSTPKKKIPLKNKNWGKKDRTKLPRQKSAEPWAYPKKKTGLLAKSFHQKAGHKKIIPLLLSLAASPAKALWLFWNYFRLCFCGKSQSI